LPKIEQNISRLKYLLKLYRISIDDLLNMVSVGLKKPILEDDLLSNSIELNYLKRIDKIFNKGLHYYLDPKALDESKEESIFFRKEKFNTELNIEARKVVNRFEEFKISLSAISKLAEINIERRIPIFSVNDNAKEIAAEVRKVLYPIFSSEKKEFLRSLITKFAETNILVFEFVETWNKKDNANVDGFFLEPFVIVLKRLQHSFRREIFTLVHELGHYLLNEEEVEKLEYESIWKVKLSKVERWCNDFAYYFLIGSYDSIINKFDVANSDNDYYHERIKEISLRTHLSELAIYTRLLYQGKISLTNYEKVRSHILINIQKFKEQLKLQREQEKAQGKKQKGSAPKPINSPLLVSTIQTAFYEGIISEYEVCKHLNIKPDKFSKYIP